MSTLNKHIIKKYNHTLVNILKYYKLYGTVFVDKSGLLNINLRLLDTGLTVHSKEELDKLHTTYPHLWPFIKFQRKYSLNCDIDKSTCIDYLHEINTVIIKINSEKFNNNI